MSGEYSCKFHIRHLVSWMPINLRPTKFDMPGLCQGAKLFPWLVLHSRILSVDLPTVCCQPHKLIYQLCLNNLKNVVHLCSRFSFQSAVWGLLEGWLGDPSNTLVHDRQSVNTRLNVIIGTTSKETRTVHSSGLLYAFVEWVKEMGQSTYLRRSAPQIHGSVPLTISGYPTHRPRPFATRVQQGY